MGKWKHHQNQIFALGARASEKASKKMFREMKTLTIDRGNKVLNLAVAVVVLLMPPWRCSAICVSTFWMQSRQLMVQWREINRRFSLTRKTSIELRVRSRGKMIFNCFTSLRMFVNEWQAAICGLFSLKRQPANSSTKSEKLEQFLWDCTTSEKTNWMGRNSKFRWT